MLVFWKEKLVFLAVPKTGTSAYETVLAPRASMTVLDPPELKHAPIYRYNRFFRPMFERMGADHMDIMAVVREPISWLGSWYRYRQRDFLDGKPTSTRGISFDEFVNAFCQGDQPPFADIGSQAKFIEPRPNGVRVTHLFQYERQDDIIAFLEKRLNVTLELPRINESPGATLVLSPGTEARLRKKYASEFVVWESAAQR